MTADEIAALVRSMSDVGRIFEAIDLAQQACAVAAKAEARAERLNALLLEAADELHADRPTIRRRDLSRRIDEALVLPTSKAAK